MSSNWYNLFQRYEFFVAFEYSQYVLISFERNSKEIFNEKVYSNRFSTDISIEIDCNIKETVCFQWTSEQEKKLTYNSPLFTMVCLFTSIYGFI